MIRLSWLRKLSSALLSVGAVIAVAMYAPRALAQGIPEPGDLHTAGGPAIQQHLDQLDATLRRNPDDFDALNLRGSLYLKVGRKSLHSFFWYYKAARDLEHAIRLNPNDFYAHHNYAQTAFQTGDMGTDQPNMRLAVIQFTKAIEINPRSARSYMGRGWAYQMLNDEPHARADYDKALQLDPSLRADLLDESNGIATKRAQLRAAQGTLERMGRYTVQRVRDQNECEQSYHGYWTQGECRLSTALNPGPAGDEAAR